jgi:hypothetical protein
MKRCRLVLNIKSKIEFRIREGEEETAEELIERIQDGYSPAWIESLIKKGLDYNDIDVERKHIRGMEPAPDEELNFDY